MVRIYVQIYVRIYVRIFGTNLRTDLLRIFELPKPCKSLLFLNGRDIRHGAHQYGKDWVPFGLLAASPVSALGLLFTIDLIHFRVLKTRNVSNLL